MQKWMKAQVAVPPGWVPIGAQALAEGRAWPALLGMLGCAAIGALGLRRAYLSTLRFYQGGSVRKGAARTARAAAAAAGTAVTGAAAAATRGGAVRDSSRFLERRLPRIPEQAAVVALATFRSMMRAPEMKLQFGTSFIITLVVGGSLLFRSTGRLPEAAGAFIATGVVVFSMFLLIGFVGNQFGFDRDGFRAFVLSPAERWTIVLGKNLAVVPMGAVASTVLLIIVTLWLHLSPFVFLATLLQLLVGLIAAALVGTLLSILLPYRIQPGSMKPTKIPTLSMVILVLAQLSLPLVLTPAFLPPLIGFVWQRAGGPPAAVVNFGLSLAMAAVVVFVYWRALQPLGRLLHRRESRILATVSVDVE
jgi:hypothetical protein